LGSGARQQKYNRKKKRDVGTLNKQLKTSGTMMAQLFALKAIIHFADPVKH